MFKISPYEIQFPADFPGKVKIMYASFVIPGKVLILIRLHLHLIQLFKIN
jgi:hypothetical protein